MRSVFFAMNALSIILFFICHNLFLAAISANQRSSLQFNQSSPNKTLQAPLITSNKPKFVNVRHRNAVPVEKTTSVVQTSTVSTAEEEITKMDDIEFSGTGFVISRYGLRLTALALIVMVPLIPCSILVATGCYCCCFARSQVEVAENPKKTSSVHKKKARTSARGTPQRTPKSHVINMDVIISSQKRPIDLRNTVNRSEKSSSLKNESVKKSSDGSDKSGSQRSTEIRSGKNDSDKSGYRRDSSGTKSSGRRSGEINSVRSERSSNAQKRSHRSPNPNEDPDWDPPSAPTFAVREDSHGVLRSPIFGAWPGNDFKKKFKEFQKQKEKSEATGKQRSIARQIKTVPKRNGRKKKKKK